LGDTGICIAGRRLYKNELSVVVSNRFGTDTTTSPSYSGLLATTVLILETRSFGAKFSDPNDGAASGAADLMIAIVVVVIAFGSLWTV
jgi:hypothetical protein